MSSSTATARSTRTATTTSSRPRNGCRCPARWRRLPGSTMRAGTWWWRPIKVVSGAACSIWKPSTPCTARCTACWPLWAGGWTRCSFAPIPRLMRVIAANRHRVCSAASASAMALICAAFPPWAIRRVMPWLHWLRAAVPHLVRTGKSQGLPEGGLPDGCPPGCQSHADLAAFVDTLIGSGA